MQALPGADGGKCAATSLILLNKGQNRSGPDSVTLMRVAPGANADLVEETKSSGGIKNLTLVKVLKEWVNGVGPTEGDFDYIRVVDVDSEFYGLEGYVLTKDMIPFKALIKHYDFKDDLFFAGEKLFNSETQTDDTYNVNFSLEENGGLSLAQLKDSKSITTLKEGSILTAPIWHKMPHLPTRS